MSTPYLEKIPLLVQTRLAPVSSIYSIIIWTFSVNRRLDPFPQTKRLILLNDILLNKSLIPLYL